MKDMSLIIAAVGFGAGMLLLGSLSNASRKEEKIITVGSVTYRITKRSDGQFMVEQVGTQNAVIIKDGINTSCKGVCDQILSDLVEFPKELFS